MDRLRRVSKLPPLGGYVEIQDESLMLGGEAANTANALVNWGADVLLSGNRIGQGPDADLLLELLTDKNLLPVLRTAVLLPGQHEAESTPVCDIYVTSDGERTMFGKGFATMDPAIDLDALPFQSGEWFTAEPNMERASRSVVTAAQAAGMNCYLMDFIREDDPIAPGSYWQSSTDWAGYRNNTQKNVQWVKDWVSRHGCFTILSDGPNGFVAGSPNLKARAYPPYPAPSVVDTTGAGDMFRAGMLFGLDKGWDITLCLQYAAAAGCLSCGSLGATTDVPSMETVLAYVEDNEQVSKQYC